MKRNTILISATALVSSLSLIGCSDSSNSQHDSHDGHDHAHHGHDHEGHDHSHDHGATEPHIYENILGEISSLPIAGDPNSELRIHHVHIPEFKAKDGNVHVNANGIPGMASMTMPFPVGEGVDLSTYSVGDKVKFTFQVNWGSTAGPAWAITKIEKIDQSMDIDYTNTINAATDAVEDKVNDLMDDHSGHDHSDHDGP